MRTTLLSTFLIGSILLSSIPPHALGRSIPKVPREASTLTTWTGRIRGTRVVTGEKVEAIVKPVVRRVRLRPRTIHATLQASLVPTPVVASPQIPEVKTPLLSIVTQKDIHLREQLLADSVLRSMPEQCVQSLKSLYVRYGDDAPRGLAGKDNIIVKGDVPDLEFRALLTHEFAHTVDLGCIEGSPESGPSEYLDGNDIMWNDDLSVLFYRLSWTTSTVAKTDSRPEDFVSGYAAADAFEDFAEAFTYYVYQREAFVERAKSNPIIAQKLRWMETHAFPRSLPIAKGKSSWDGTVPWDTTILPYTLLQNTNELAVHNR